MLKWQLVGNNQVVYLRYAKADELVDVLKGVSDNLQAEKQGGTQGASSNRGEVVIASAYRNERHWFSRRRQIL